MVSTTTKDNLRCSRFFEGVIFDLNGTLVEIFKRSEYNEHLTQMASFLDLSLEKFKVAWKKAWEHYPDGNYPSVTHRINTALAYYFEGQSDEENPSKQMIDRAAQNRINYIKNQQLRIREGVFDLLEWCKGQGYKIGMVSNCSMETPLTWPDNPLAKYFPFPSFSSELGIKKPDPRIFHHQLELMEIEDLSRCIYIADGDDHELDAAEKLGMTSILIKYKLEDAFRHEEFPQSQYTTYDFRKIPEIIEEI